MAINNLNPRRTVWFSPNEPSNKYDIWLSRNAHLDENGESTMDSTSQRGCDYIFKIYDCGKWNPIVGFNATASNKMNIVKDSPSYTGIDGTSHTDFQEFHLPLFRDPSYSPDELFDAGTVGTVIKNYVTSLDWYNIIHSGGLGSQIEYYWNENPFTLEAAKPNKLGGIYAHTFGNQYTSTGTSGSYLAQAKYKYNASSDYNLYVHAKDLIDVINYYSEDNPSSGINIGGGSTIDPLALYNSFYNSPTILKGWSDNLSQAQKPRFELSGSMVVENRGKIPMLRDDDWWETHGSGYTGDYDDTNSALVWIDPYDPEQITIQLEDILQNTSSIGWTLLESSNHPVGITPQIYNVNYENRGRFLRIKPEFDGNTPSGGWNSTNCAVIWDDLDIGDLEDVSISEPLNNLVLMYNSSTGKWENGTIAEDRYISTNATDIIVTGDLSESTYTFKLYPNYRYICLNPIDSLMFFNYSNQITHLSYFDFSTTTTIGAKPVLKFDNSYDFIETHTINSTSYSSNFYYDTTYNLYVLELKTSTKYIVTVNGNNIWIDAVSDKDTLFGV